MSCKIEDCDKPHKGHGYCQMHLARLKRHSDVKTVKYHKTHGLHNTPEYTIWVNIKQRCLNPNNKSYRYYGGRGITMCDRWLKFENFFEDVGQKPDPKLTLDRIDNNGDYEPDNVRWASMVVQNHNQGMKVNNTSGYKGVYWRKGKNPWVAYYFLNRKLVFVGNYATKEEAAVARAEAQPEITKLINEL